MAIGSNPCGCPEGITNCAEAYDCITTHICPNSGIRIDEDQGCFGVALGSCLGFDAQGRIAYICGSEPGPGPCRRSFAGLTDDEFIFCGRHGGAANLVAWGSPQAIQYAVGHGLGMIEVHCFTLDDGVATWAPQDRAQALTYYTTNLASDAWNRESHSWVSITSDPGDPSASGNFTGRNAQAPDARKTGDGDGGYFGYRMPPFSLLLAAEGLSQVDGRALVNLFLPSSNGIRPEDVNGAIRAIGTVCAQAWAMITVGTGDLSSIPTITAANITAGVLVTDPASATPQEVIDAGATWVIVEDSFTEEETQPWIDSALEVLVRTNSRQYETDRARQLGARGVVCHDPVFASNDFRGTHSQSWQGRENGLGILDYRTDQGTILGARGYTINEENGLFLYNAPEVAAVFPDQPVALFQNELIGTMRPDDPASEWPNGSYQIDVFLRAYWESVPQQDGSRMGFAFGSNFDVEMSGATTGRYGDRYVQLRSGYFCWVDVEGATGNMRIERIDQAGVTPLGFQGSTAAVVEGAVRRYTLTVTPTTIRFERSDGVFVEVNDDTYRGVWMYAVTQYANTGTNTDAWETGFSYDPLW